MDGIFRVLNDGFDCCFYKNEQLQALLNEAHRAEASGLWAHADKIYTQLRSMTDEPLLRQQHAMVVLRSGDLARAATMLRASVKADPENLDLAYQLAEIYSAQKRYSLGRRLLEGVLEKNPNHIGALRRLGKIAHQENDYEFAMECLQKLLAAEPDDIEGGLLLGAVLINDGRRYEEAQVALERIIAIEPDNPTIVHNYGLLKRFMGDLEAAEKHLTHACELRPNDSNFAFSLGGCYLLMERMEDAHRWYSRATELDQNNNAAAVYVAFTLFLLGKPEEGWQQYEKRLEIDVLKDATYERPRWRGEKDIEGKPILLLSEQGMGDNIQFIRYAPLISDLGATVIVATNPALSELFKSLRGDIHVMTAIPEPRYFYRYSPLMSLPLAFGTGSDNIPNETPYLTAPEDHVKKWSTQLGDAGRLKVGLCWRGNPHHNNDEFRSSSLREMRPLLEIDDVDFFCLSKSLPEHEADLPEEIVNLGAGFDDFCDVSGVMASLDLIISVDTAICHMAGALGRPVWTMLARGPDFRWGLRGTETAWYPSMRLYRQSTLGDWSGPVAAMKEDLRAMASA